MSCHPLFDTKNLGMLFTNTWTIFCKQRNIVQNAIWFWRLLSGNSKRYPAALQDNNLLKRLKRGDYHTASSDGIRVTVWKDNKDGLLSPMCILRGGGKA